MFLQIHDTQRLKDLQERSEECFPYLRLRFYSEAHKRFEASDAEALLDGDRQVAQVRTRGENGAYEIKSWYTVSLVERDLKKKYGLNAQIFRTNKKGEWIQTVQSDRLTLDEQSRFAYDYRLNI